MAVNETARDHAGHDELLVVAYASDDLSGREAERAAALAAGCAECRRLAADVRELRTSVAALPVPRRTRDFRLTDADAERLRPRGWRGLVALVAGPRLSFAAPIGTAIATIGIAGLLVATAPSLFMAGTASTPALTASGGASVQSAENAPGGLGAGSSDTGAAAAVPGPAIHASAAAPAAASAAASAAAAEPYAAATAAPDQSVTSPPLAAAPNPASTAEPAATLPAQAKSAAEPTPSAEARISAERTSPGTTAAGLPWLAIASSVLVLLGLVLVLGRLAARRLSI